MLRRFSSAVWGTARTSGAFEAALGAESVEVVCDAGAGAAEEGNAPADTAACEGSTACDADADADTDADTDADADATAATADERAA